ncbi:uncharacterized protein LOC142142508 [Mixophyes fleayi]|uniref:uncharacterized protein LOC142142508 n=1 Tax=Mixophyes fleayi TaxID=3061075 RepID=UPI003F4DFFCD
MMRNMAMQELVKACLPYHPGATVEWAKSKIQNLRTVYKKELNKVEASKKSGAAAEDVYVPKLWYFDMLHFVKDQETPRTSISSMPTDSSSSPEVEQAYDIPASGTPALLSDGLLLEVEDPDATTIYPTPRESQLTADRQDATQGDTPAKINQKRKRRRIHEIAESDALAERMLDCANSLLTPRKEQETFELLASTLASKMRISSKRIQTEMERLLFNYHGGFQIQANICHEANTGWYLLAVIYTTESGGVDSNAPLVFAKDPLKEVWMKP